MIESRPLRLVLVTLAAVVIGSGCGSPGARLNPTTAMGPNVVPGPEVSVAQAAEWHDMGAFVLDVREPNEWAAGHIRGATLIPLGELANRLAEVPPDRAVVVVCRTGNRSAQGRDILRGAGFSAVTSMVGGMTDWIGAGLEVVTGP
jgi:rhodanese-related sulfurtransferase